MSRDISQERLISDVHRVLDNPFWITEIEPNEPYKRLHDDHDGERNGSISVNFSGDGDAWINIQSKRPGQSLRFRTFHGGGQSPRVRNALMILALAIKIDNQEKEQ